jgi:hypothetical protein
MLHHWATTYSLVINELECVYSAVRTGSLNITQVNYSLKSADLVTCYQAMSQSPCASMDTPYMAAADCNSRTLSLHTVTPRQHVAGNPNGKPQSVNFQTFHDLSTRRSGSVDETGASGDNIVLLYSS